MRSTPLVSRKTALLVACVLLLARTVSAEDIRVMTSGAFTAAYVELVPQLEHVIKGKIVTAATSMGTGPDSIPSRLERGEHVDVVIVADAALDQLIKNGRVLANSRVDLARSGIGMAVRAGARKPDISSLAALRRALLDAKSIAYSASVSGRYLSTELFQRLGIADQVMRKSRQIDRERVGAVIARGEAEIGFQQISELLPEPGIDYVGPLPPEVQRMTVFSAGVATSSRNADAARAVIRFLASAEAAGAVAKSGLEPLAPAQAGAAPRNDLPQPYRTLRDWGELPAGAKWAAVTAIEPAPDGSIYVIHRCFANSCAGRSEAPILKYNVDGKLLASWGAGMFVFPHGAAVDRDGNIWVTDARGENGKGHQVFKFSPDGKVLMTLGKAGVSGGGPDLFDQPTDIVVSPAGDLFVTDSHRNGRNNRVVRFTKDGKYVKEWGRKGSGRGEFSEPHTIAMDSRGRLFVGDRENNRIQIFDQDGTFLDEWRQFGRPSGIFITKDDTIYVADSESGPDTGAHELIGIKKGIRIGSARDGKVTAFIEDMESTTPDHSGAEGVGVDAHGNVYGGVVRRQMLERHVKK